MGGWWRLGLPGRRHADGGKLFGNECDLSYEHSPVLWNHELLVYKYDRLPYDNGRRYGVHLGPGQCGHVPDLLQHVREHRIRPGHLSNPRHHGDDVLVLELLGFQLPDGRDRR